MTNEHNIAHVPMLDTGLGIEAGYANDKELIEAAKAQREEMKALLTPAAWERFEAEELALQRTFLFGRGRVHP